MKTISTELQADLINFLTAAKDAQVRLPDQHNVDYFLEELRPKRIRRKVKEAA